MPENAFRPLLKYKLIALVFLIAVLGPAINALMFHAFSITLFIIPLAIAFAGISLVTFLLSPLEKLFTAARLFAKGELTHQIDITSNDEIQALAAEFNQMAKSLSTLIAGASSEKGELSTERNKLNTVISSISEGVIVLNMHKQVVLANQSAEQITGYSFVEMQNKSVDELFTLTDKGGTPILSKDYAPVELTQDPLPLKYESKQPITLTNKKSVSKIIKLIGSPITGNIQADLGCVLLIHDASPEKELESIQLDFVSMASHELRTPLTSVIGYLSVFMDENKAVFNESQKEELNRIFISAKQLNALIDNLLSVSKVERGAFSINLTPMDWKQLITKIVEDNRIQAIQKNISLTLSLPETDLPKVNIDPVRISEVLNNLISNSINYTKSGGSITVISKIEGAELITSVTDTGVGIPKDALEHLFTKFFRVSGALDASSNSKGTGLGLYISKSVIDLHHGRIWAESEVGKGSTFSFTLPLG